MAKKASEHVTYYKNANGVYLIKIQDESFDNLLDKIKDWNLKHKIGE